MVSTSASEEAGAYPLRRTPTQDRANRQVERILDAACAEVVERGYDAASTSSIAKRAEIAVGSVYRYFPDKRTLIQAIERRNQHRYTEAVRARLADVQDWRQAVEVTLETFREMHRTDPGFRAVVLSGLGDPELEATPGEFDDQHAGEFAELLSRRFGAEDSKDFRLTVTLTITMGEALAHLADRLPDEDAERVLSHGLPTLHRLLEPYLS
ncbi:TetR/AcrR family transcriptional regulator [Kribbella amoyensis]|nr:TetR/AcrR family transcriptional regulator [Kribbella amoyensis]